MTIDTIKAPLSGATAPLRALGLLRQHRALWPYVLWPVLLNLVLGLTLYAALLWAGFGAIERTAAAWPPELAGLAWLLKGLLGLLLLVATGFVLVRFGVVLGAPFYGRLAEEIAAIAGGRDAGPQRSGALGAAGDILRALRFELSKLLIVIPIALLLLLGNLLPIGGQILGLVGGALLGALIACLDFFDATLERRRLGFRQKLGVVRRLFPASLGFGLVAFALVSVPFINLLAVPLCVAAGTLLLIEREG